MNNYLYAELNKNSFYVLASGNILDKDFEKVRFKIDTGCTFSTVPISKLYLFNAEVSKGLKSKDIESGIDFSLSYGVESGGIKHSSPKTFEEKLNCPAIKFKHKITNFTLDNYKLPDLDIYVNYDRHGNILIGMDILSLFDIHMGVSLKTGKETLIGVLKEQSNKYEYYKALYEHFNLVSHSYILAEVFRNK